MAFGSSASLTFDIFARDHNAVGTFDRVGSSAKGTFGPLSGMGSKLKTVAKYGALAAAAAGVMAAKFGADAVGAASDLNETVSKSRVIFGKSSREIEKWADTADRSMGQSKRQALDAASTFGIIGQKAGLSGKDTAGFAKKFAGLASDMASFSNTSPDDAITAIGAAMRGEMEPIRKYGVLLDDATLRNRALKMGLIDSVKTALTPQQKALAASKEILAQTDKAQGDFARTSDGLANQQRILAAQFENVKAKIGQALLPMAVKVVKWINDDMIPGAKKLWGWLKEKLGPVFAFFGDVIKNKVIPFVKDIGERLGNDLPGFVGDAKQAFKDAQPFFDRVGDAFQNVIGPAIKWVADHVLPAMGGQLRVLGKAMGKMGDIFRWVWNNIMAPQFKYMAKAIALTLELWARMLDGMSHIPGFGWAADAADKLHAAAAQADGFANSIKKIPPRKEVTIHTTYTYSGLQNNAGPTRGRPDDFGAPKTSTGSGSGKMSGSSSGRFSGKAATAGDLQRAMEGLTLRVVGPDPGMRAYLQTGGSSRY